MKSKPNDSDSLILNLNRNFPTVYSVDTRCRKRACRLELAGEACDDPLKRGRGEGPSLQIRQILDARALRRK
jgi:hypothetical protein